jgi:hypothetical protein
MVVSPYPATTSIQSNFHIALSQYPFDTEALYALEIVSDFEADGGNVQTGNFGIFQADIRLDCIGIGRNSMSLIDIYCRHQFDGGPWLGMPKATAG